MIFDHCMNWKNYAYGDNKAFEKAFEFLANLEPDCEDGRIDIDGDSMFAMVQGYSTKPIEEGKIEIHKRYIDIQALLSGTERIFYSSVMSLKEDGEFSDENDCGFFEYVPEQAIELKIAPGTFAVFMPEEGHMPCISPECGSNEVKKVVVKIDSALL
ncbi:MAG: DUF386 domain-containing protein [Lentisphaerae bacterium]|nr:DUF386 domain-containing protein [Lentisphaerota bacterium]MCP4103389.1 DUF386 domain-containing protein [Lentisphaerota bacterium]